MAKPQPVPLAKLSQPRLHGVLARERLFDVLDDQRRRPAVWISGPPGAGKTTLVASYLQARNLPCLWYQVDGGDADPASFFYYLAQAAPRTRSARQAPLLLLSPEYLADLPGFTRRFFRALQERMPPMATLVLDNFQDAAQPSAFHAIVRHAIGEAREGFNLIVLSRGDPPEAFAREQANGQVGLLGWDELRLTTGETLAIATAEGEIDAATLRLLHAQSDGWVAGLVLMLQRLRQRGAVPAGLPLDTREALFAYFAGQVFEQVPPATQALLLRTAYLPRITAPAACTLSGDDTAGTLLDQLHRQRLFTDRHESLDAGTHASSIGYAYHALFRAFLQSRTEASLSTAELRALRTCSAELLEAGGDAAEALRLHAVNADWDAATALILRRARGLIAEGRWLTIKAWVALLPKEKVAQTAWLMLWVGSSQVLVDPARARAMLERAFERFVESGDEVGQVLVATATIESHNIECTEFGAMDPWIDVLERLLPKALAYPSESMRLRAHAALMLGALLRRPAHPMLPACVQQTQAVLALPMPPSAKADTATLLLQFFDFSGDLQSARELSALAQPLFESEELSPFRRAGWLVFFSYHAALTGAYREGFDALDRLRGIVQDYGMKWFGFFDLFFRALLHLLGPTPLLAAPLMQPLGAQVRSNSPAESAQYHLARVLHYQAQGEASLAIYHGELCLEAAGQSGSLLFDILFPTVVSSAFVEAGQPERALALVAQARALGAGTAYRFLEAPMLMAEAYAQAARRDLAQAQALLDQALTRARTDRTAALLRWFVLGYRRMLAMAIGSGIQPELARSLIAEFGITAESAEVDHWPWPIRIHTLGRFALEIDGAPPQAERKVQKKPLEMLKVLVAHGGRDVASTAIHGALWPDAAGDASADNFEVTLRRLRKLLGRDDAVLLKDGKLALNPGLCWIDTWAFERAQARAESLLHAGAPLTAGGELDALAERVLALYPGHFLAGDEDAPWLMACRQRLASKLQRHAMAVGELWQARGYPARAERTYQRALEQDALAEALYRRLMRVQAQQGHHAEALETFRRCRQMLSVVLGVEPSAETETLRRSLLRQRH